VIAGAAAPFALLGAGTGVAFPAASVTVLSRVDEDVSGFASGLTTAAHEAGAGIGAALFPAVAARSGR